MGALVRSLLQKNHDAVIAAIVGYLLVLHLCHHSGIGVSPDSVVYMSVARNLHNHGILIDFNARPLVVFPAGYSIFLSLVMWLTGHDPLAFGASLDGFMFAVLILLAGYIMEQFAFRNRWYRYGILICMVFSPCLLEIYTILWSETLFLILLLLFFIFLGRYFRSHQLKYLIVASVIASIACATRYAGVTFVAAAGLLILTDMSMTFWKRIWRGFILGIISSVLLGANLIRNFMADGTGTGMREKSLTSFMQNIYNYGNILCEWLPVPKDHFVLAFGVALIFIFGAGLLWRMAIKHQRAHSYENIAVVYFLVYSLFIILSATWSRYELISSRLMSPVFVPMLWTGSTWLLPYFKKAVPGKNTRIATAGLVLFGIFQVSQFKVDFDNYDGIRDAGIPGYTEDPWQKKSDFVNFLRKNTWIFKSRYALYSNSDDALYFFTGLRCDMVPHRVFPQEINDFYAERYCYLIWFDDTDNPELLSRENILAHKKMRLIYQCVNGSIYVTD